MARGLAVAAVALCCLVVVAPAGAASGTYSCAGLQAGLNQAGNNDTITLDDANLCTGNYTLPNFDTPTGIQNYKSWTLTGTAGSGFSPTSGRALTGTDVHRLELTNLIFRNGSAADGGAIKIDGESSPAIRSSSFFHNTATGKGGAIYIAPVVALVGGAGLGGVVIDGNTFGSTTANDKNTAQNGGAVAVDMPGQGQNSSFHDNTFRGNVASQDGGAYWWRLDPDDLSGENFSVFFNTVVGNKAAGVGGGGYIVQHGVLRVDGELYEGNSIDPTVGTPALLDHHGGGLYAEVDGTSILRHNTFKSNSIIASLTGHDYGGGGLAMIGTADISSEFGRFESNTVAGQPDSSGFESEGGGLYIHGQDTSYYGFLDAIAGNSVGDYGRGGGIYTGASTDATTLELGEVTVAGNTVGAHGGFRDIAGDGEDTLIMRNSIAYTGGAGDVGGFITDDVRYTDACNANGAVFTGPGNLCADPKLEGGADVHQTKLSPTIDKGDDTLSNAEGGERPNTDYEGDPRPTDGDGDGHTVDMGADETPAGFLVEPPPPPPHVPQCSDGADNDGDGAIDIADPGCLAGPTDDNEGDETPGDLVLCGSRDISLVRADVKGSKVQLSGFVAIKYAGQKVTLSVRYLKKAGKAEKLGIATASADGSFQGKVKKPKRKAFTLARYRAQVGTAKSVELKLPQSLASSSLKLAGGQLELRGQVDRALLGKRNAVVVKRILCGRYATVGQAKPDRKGRYLVRFPAPATTTGSALYRAETKVLARPGSNRYVKQFARAIGITF